MTIYEAISVALTSSLVLLNGLAVVVQIVKEIRKK
ncbi:putative holin-like toxin [Aquibacillus albus]|uniref:Holin-like toxin n=1 Tax=Aquibacillus albus TaxID=1168171 RepID=A0ABS2MZS5_9BACI|nr:hypothetical protein [Aquibacillus albus]